MGSPYMTFQVTRVSVVRTEKGFLDQLKQLCQITGSQGLYYEAVSYIGGLKKLEAEAGKCTRSTNPDDTSVVEDEFWGHIHGSSYPFSSFSQSTVKLVSSFVAARRERKRVVVFVGTTYDQAITPDLDRVIVFDFTKRTPRRDSGII